jgi:hypothetical protein
VQEIFKNLKGDGNTILKKDACEKIIKEYLDPEDAEEYLKSMEPPDENGNYIINFEEIEKAFLESFQTQVPPIVENPEI